MDDNTPRRQGTRWIFADGTTLPVVSGGDGPDEPGGDPPSPPSPPAPPATETGKTFTQAELDKIAGESRDAGRKAAEKALLDSLGVTDLDAAKAALDAARAADEANKTELQRATEERDRLKAEADQATARADDALRLAKLEGALRDAGINPARVTAALRLIDRGTLTVEGDAVSGAPEAVSALKASTPEWFGATNKAPDASGGDPPVTDYRTASDADLARELGKYGIRT